MQVTIEMSLYPLTENYTDVIIDFIKALRKYENLEIRSTAMSTYVTGSYDVVMEILTKELKNVYANVPDSSTVLKIIPKDLNVEDGFLEF